MKNIILFSFITLLFFSCESNSEKNEPVTDKLRIETLNYLASHYGAVVGFDSLRYALTYQYQEFIDKNNKVILGKFRICDVVKQDSTYIVSIKNIYMPQLFIDLSCNESQVKKLLAGISGEYTRYIRFRNKYIIATISSIHKIKFEVDSEVDSESKGRPYLDVSDAFLCKGRLIDVYDNSENRRK